MQLVRNTTSYSTSTYANELNLFRGQSGESYIKIMIDEMGREFNTANSTLKTNYLQQE
jgi:hypothetical protein